MKYLIIIALLLTSYTTQAVELDIGLGYTMTEKPPNGRWYQREFDHTIDSNDTNYQIGLRFNPADNIYLTTGYKYLGKFSVSADFIGNDRSYEAWKRGEVDPPINHLTGEGKAHGIYFKGEYHFKHIFLTAGGWAHKSEWKVHSPHEFILVPSGPQKGEIIGPLNWTHENKADISFSYIVGAGVKVGKFSILAEIWDTANSTKELPATYLGKSQVITLLYTL